MLIGIDGTAWLNQRGYGRHMRSLIDALLRIDQKNQYVILSDQTIALPILRGDVEVRVVGTHQTTIDAARSDRNRSMHDLWQVSKALSSNEFDIIFFPTVYSYAPVLSRAKKVIVIHDVIPEKYPHLTLPTLSSRFFWKSKTAMARWQANAIVTVSDYSKKQIVDYFRIDSDQVFVVGEAPDPHFRVIAAPSITPSLANLGFTKEQKFILYVGGFGPHKNLQSLLFAFAEICEQYEYQDILLVMVGEYKNESFFSCFPELESLVVKLGIQERVLFTGFLDDDDLVILMNFALVLVLPSLMEGYGLPAIEAAACGCPVIGTLESPLPELLGDSGVYFNPEDDRSLVNALSFVLSSPSARQKMSKLGQEKASLLTWEEAAEKMIEVFDIAYSK